MNKKSRFIGNSFPKQVYDKMKGKGWFEVKDVLDMYCQCRDVPKNSYQYDYMSGDCSWRLKLKCDVGAFERKPNPKYKGHFLYRVI